MANTEKQYRIFLPLAFAAVMVLGMQLGFKMNDSVSGKRSNQLLQMSSMDEVINYIDARYVDTVNGGELEDQAIIEMLRGLDPHSSYIPAAELKEVEENLQGNFEGIGVEFSLVKDTITVVTPIAGGPSEALGIRAGDKIIKIEDTLVAGVNITSEQVMAKLRGPKDTKVNVSIYRKGVRELLDYEIVRNKIPIVSLDAAYMLDKNIGYIKLNRFSQTTFDEFYEALQRLKQEGMAKLILDLRQNPGGFLTAAVNIADEFIDSKKRIVYTEGRSYKRKDYDARRPGMFESGDLVVLVDEGSASASEIVAGAIQDWDRGTIIGRRSFGKGLVQDQFELSNGAALRLTIARYYTPAGRCIQKPYEEGELEDYNEDLDKRFKHGELQNADSLAKLQQQDTSTYYTLVKKRKLFGGGGIMPDVFVPLDTTHSDPFTIKARSAIPQFAYDYYGNHTNELKAYPTIDEFKKQYRVNEAMFADFKQYLKREVGFIDNVLLQRDRKEFEIYIMAYLARQLYGNTGFYPIVQENDKTLQKAIVALQQK